MRYSHAKKKQVRKARLYPALIPNPSPFIERQRERERTVEEEEELSGVCVERYSLGTLTLIL